MGSLSGDDSYSPPTLARLLHALPHLNVTLHWVPSNFDPKSPVYLESLGILGSVPAAWLILTLLILLIYLLTRCCDRKARPSRSISVLKVTLAIISVLCCAAIGLGLYGNDDLHNGFTQLLSEAKQVNQLISRIRNQTEAIERQLKIQASSQLTQLQDVFDAPVQNMTAYGKISNWLETAYKNNDVAGNATASIRGPLKDIHLGPTIVLAEKIEAMRWPATMAVLSVLLVLCVILLVGVVRHNRCALIAFSVCGLLAVIVSHLMASVYISAAVALGDLCVAPEDYLETQFSSEASREILRYYTSCESARANPFTQRLREAKTAVEAMRGALNSMRGPALELFPKRGLETKFTSLINEVNSVDMLITSLTALVDCRALHANYSKGAKGLCNVGLLGLGLMLLSAVLGGLLLTALVWIDSHTWIYIRKRKDYHQVNETDTYLPAPAASQAIAARTLQRSQGSSYPPDTPPPSYTSALLHSRTHAASAPHEAHPFIDGCDMRPSDQHRTPIGSVPVPPVQGAHLSHLRGHTLGRLPSHHHHHHESLSGPNNGKYATLSKQCKTLESSDFY